MRPLFITIEGPDGAGKTTAAANVRKRLEARGITAICTREPGGSAIGEKIRTILLDPENSEMDEVVEAILYAASRRQHLKDIVLPALESGTTVICDRFVDSSLAYQGVARGIGFDKVWSINEPAIDGHLPDITFLLEISEEEAAKRMDNRGTADRIELEGRTFQKKVNEGFALAKKRFPDRIVSIDATKSPDELADEICEMIMEKAHG